MDLVILHKRIYPCSTNTPQPPNKPLPIHIFPHPHPPYLFPRFLLVSSITFPPPVTISFSTSRPFYKIYKLFPELFVLFTNCSQIIIDLFTNLWYNNNETLEISVSIQKCATPSSLNITLFIVVRLAHFYV